MKLYMAMINGVFMTMEFELWSKDNSNYAQVRCQALLSSFTSQINIMATMYEALVRQPNKIKPSLKEFTF